MTDWKLEWDKNEEALRRKYGDKKEWGVKKLRSFCRQTAGVKAEKNNRASYIDALIKFKISKVLFERYGIGNGPNPKLDVKTVKSPVTVHCKVHLANVALREPFLD
ncbi:MAG: hypothetical protein ACREOZ_03485 [Gloeomargaritales cyanobacterium]